LLVISTRKTQEREGLDYSVLLSNYSLALWIAPLACSGSIPNLIFTI
jgi:hypothetical protein